MTWRCSKCGSTGEPARDGQRLRSWCKRCESDRVRLAQRERLERIRQEGREEVLRLLDPYERERVEGLLADQEGW